MSYLILVRHGESEWNAKGLWTGLTDIPLSDNGKEEARRAASSLTNIPLNCAFTSKLIRAKETLDIILHSLHQESLPTEESSALNERDYGEYTGKNKWDIEKEIGEDAFTKIRRGWDTPIPQGESLKDVYNRVVPYYTSTILPRLRNGENILLVAHGNSIRALIKLLENISDADIEHIELKTGEVYFYSIDESGSVIAKEIKKSDTE